MARSLTSMTAAMLVLPVALAAMGCDPAGSSERSEQSRRWATTENTNVAIDWDKVNEAYRLADGPEDLERRVNEIYGGTEVISVSVADVDAKTQVVTGFFDRDGNGAVDDAEKIFTIRREVADDSSGRYQTVGHGAYAGYHSPFLGIATGMLMGSMMSRAFMPGYMPMYQQPYTTSPARAADVRQTRSGYRAANPGKFQSSQSGRTYGRPSTRTPSGSRGFGGGGKFGVATKGTARRLDV